MNFNGGTRASVLRGTRNRWISGGADSIGRQPWTPWQLRRLRELKAEGKTRVEIAAEIGRTVESVRGKLNELRRADGDSGS